MKHSLMGAVIAALLALTATVITSTDASAAAIPGHWYKITSRANSAYCLDVDVSSGGPFSGDRVQLYTCNGRSNQMWYWDGSYLLSANAIGGGWCLAVNESGGAQMADGHRAVVYTCVTETNLRFSLNSDGSIQNHWNGKCLDANASAIGDGDSIAYWGCVTGKPNQLWDFHPLS